MTQNEEEETDEVCEPVVRDSPAGTRCRPRRELREESRRGPADSASRAASGRDAADTADASAHAAAAARARAREGDAGIRAGALRLRLLHAARRREDLARSRRTHAARELERPRHD